MKRFIISILLTVLTGTAVQAQQKVTLAECSGDTVIYVKKNFVEGKARFIGQPFSKVLDEWRSQLPVGRLLFGNTGIWPTKEEDQNLVNSADIYFDTEETIDLKGMRHEAYYGVGISFEPPFSDKTQVFWQLQEEEDSQLGPQLYEKLKDYIVKKISSFEMKF